MRVEDLCGLKRGYPHKGAAIEAAQEILRCDVWKDCLYVYPCPDCGKWHATSRRDGTEKHKKTQVRRKSRHPPKKRRLRNKRCNELKRKRKRYWL